MKSFPILVLALLLLMLASDARAQGYSIDWFATAGGGGSSTGSVNSISGTIGQSAANGTPMTNNNFSLTSGFWALYAVQTEGAPLLAISRINSVVMVSWSSTSTNWILQQNTSLGSNNWIAAPEIATDNGGVKFIIVNPPICNRFYRLILSP